MRQIRFRGWNPRRQRMVYNVVQWHSDIQGEWVFPEVDANYIRNEKEFPVMQFTGLFDKNGEEIYEGDIVKHLFAVNSCEVQFLSGSFEARDEKMDETFTLACNKNLIEVIGNIHQNKDLLEKENEKH